MTTGSRKRKQRSDDTEDEGGDSEEASDDEEDGSVEGSEGTLEEGGDDEDDPLLTSDEDGDDSEASENEADELRNDADSSDEESDTETPAERERKAAFFAESTTSTDKHASFVSMNLSRPILKALTSLSFNVPTPIQSATIPVALLGKDVVGNAVTGSGKTAAFIIPMLERLLYREKGKKAAATRCLILVPTRELGVQCFEVGKKLSAHTDIQFCLAVGRFISHLCSSSTLLIAA
jgi:ATP-dependent RNA helicase DDX27